jgi:hypothetical protein
MFSTFVPDVVASSTVLHALNAAAATIAINNGLISFFLLSYVAEFSNFTEDQGTETRGANSVSIA